MTLRKSSKSVVRAVSRDVRYGGTGRCFTQEMRAGRHADAFFRSGKCDETSDAREARNAYLTLRCGGSFVAHVKLDR